MVDQNVSFPPRPVEMFEQQAELALAAAKTELADEEKHPLAS
jgi:hypothetical protein